MSLHNLLPSEFGKIGFMVHQITFADHRSGKDGIQLRVWLIRKEIRLVIWSWKHNRTPDHSFTAALFKRKADRAEENLMRSGEE